MKCTYKKALVYNEHSGEIVGSTNLGNINNYLANFEQSLVIGPDSSPNLPKNYGCFMV